MPVAEAALFGGFAHSLWSYNRENWQWDWQVRQACEFQRQNMAVSRYSLFRDDIRDLAALTVNKMDSYLIVNTLKLGFIVTIFLNYDRSDGVQHPGYMERQVTLLFSVCILTSFLFLLISIWLSMHASIVAQSFTTKMLLQAARIPVATDQEITSAAPAAKAYETSLDALRLPLQGTGGTSGATGDTLNSTSRAYRASPVPWAPVPEQQDPPSGLQNRSSIGSPQALPTLDQPCANEELDANPHLKFYSLLMRNWQTFDLYSKVCMSIGTSTLLSGIAYYATYFSRSGSDKLAPFASGWFCFGFMSVLAWWSVTIDVVLKRVEHALWAAVALSGPLTAAVAIVCEKQSLMILAALLQGCWVWFLCGSALALRNGLPRRWRASLYIDILNPFAPNSCTAAGRLAPSSSLSRAPPPAAAAAADQLLQCLDALLAADVASQLEEEVVDQIRSSRNRLVQALVHVGWPEVSRAKGSGKGVSGNDPLRRTLSEGSTPTSVVSHDGFWLSRDDSHRIWVSLGDAHAVSLFLRRNKGYETSVGELMETSAVLLRAMKPKLSSWTSRDAGRLAAYGGAPDAAASLKAFEAQFRTKGQAAKSSMGQSARRFFQASSAVVSIAWLLAPITSAIINAQPSEARETLASLNQTRLAIHLENEGHRNIAFANPPKESIKFLKQLYSFKMPRSWFFTAFASCTSSSDLSADFGVSDGLRAFTSRSPGNALWKGPISCDGTAVAAIALSSTGEVFAQRHRVFGSKALAILLWVVVDVSCVFFIRALYM